MLGVNIPEVNTHGFSFLEFLSTASIKTFVNYMSQFREESIHNGLTNQANASIASNSESTECPRKAILFLASVPQVTNLQS